MREDRSYVHESGHVATSERGAALIVSLLVALILVFLGMGLLLQTSLGLQASGTDRWVTKALYAADAGAMMQIEMIQLGAIGALQPGTPGAPGNFVLVDDPGLPGLLKGQFNVTISNFCESQPATPVLADVVRGTYADAHGNEQFMFSEHSYIYLCRSSLASAPPHPRNEPSRQPTQAPSGRSPHIME
jgi:Tfp pilus assembly protein PilX